MTKQGNRRLGPIELAPGVAPLHVITKLYAAFISVAMLSGMSILQAFILTEHLEIPRRVQGTVSGDLTVVTELAAILLFGPMGILADRIGRRPVFVGGILVVGLAYGLYPFATSIGELIVYRLIFAVGLSATAGMIATLTNDYPVESSRGKLIGLSAIANTLGAMFIAGVISRIPTLAMGQGLDAVSGGKLMFLTAAGLCLITSIVARLGLKGGTPVAPEERASVRVLMTSGLRSAMNPRIALSYAAAFAARSDLVIKGLFLSLWAIQAGSALGLSPAESMARFGLMLLIMHGSSMLAAPIFGWFIDQVNRVTSAVVALAVASAGYLSMALITSPLDFDMVPFFIVISLGSGFVLKASMGLVGQEAPVKERGSIIAVNGIFGSIGILIMTLFGGRWFDTLGPSSVFVIAGAYQGVLMCAAVIIRVVAPGRQVVGRRRAVSGGAAAASSGARQQIID